MFENGKGMSKILAAIAATSWSFNVENEFFILFWFVVFSDFIIGNPYFVYAKKAVRISFGESPPWFPASVIP